MDDGASNKVEAETDVRHRDKSFRIEDRDRVSSNEPGRSSDMLGMNAANLFQRKQETTKSSKPWWNTTRRDTSELHFGWINVDAVYQSKDMGTKQWVNLRTKVMHHMKPTQSSVKGRLFTSRGATALKEV